MTLARALPLPRQRRQAPPSCSDSRRSASRSLPVLTLAVLVLRCGRPPLAAQLPRRIRVRPRAVRHGRVVGLHRAPRRSAARRTAVALLGTAVFVALLALWPALAGCVAARATPPSSVARTLVAAARVDTRRMAARLHLHRASRGSPSGTRSCPAARSPGFAPLGGVFAVSLAVALVAAMRRACVRRRCRALVPVRGRRRRRHRRAVRRWRPRSDAISMDCAGRASRSQCRSCRATCRRTLKFDPQFREQHVRDLCRTGRVEPRPARSCCPRARIPMFSDEVPDAVIHRLIRTASARGGDVLLGLFTAEAPAPGSTETRYYQHGRRARRAATCSSTASVTSCRSARRFPPKAVFGWFIRNVLAIPLADQTPAARRSRRSSSPASAWPSTSATRTRSAASSSTARATRRLARQRDQRRVVRPLDRRRSSTTRSPRCARAGARAADAPRDQHRHHVGDRARRAASSPSCRGSRAACSRSRSTGARDATPYQRFGDGPTLALAAVLVALGCAGAHAGASEVAAAGRHRADRPATERQHTAGRNLPAARQWRCRIDDPVKSTSLRHPHGPRCRRSSRSFSRSRNDWDRQGCALLQPYDMEVGAGTSHTATFCARSVPSRGAPRTCSRRAVRRTAATARIRTACSTTTSSRSC